MKSSSKLFIVSSLLLISCNSFAEGSLLQEAFKQTNPLNLEASLTSKSPEPDLLQLKKAEISPIGTQPKSFSTIKNPDLSNIQPPETPIEPPKPKTPQRTIFKRKVDPTQFELLPKKTLPLSKNIIPQPSDSVPLAAKTTKQPSQGVKQKNDAWGEFGWQKWDQENKKEDIKITPYMSGMGEIKLYSLKVNAKNRQNALSNAVYKSLTGKIKEVDFQIESRFNLLLIAKINEDAEVKFNIVQEPNMPQKTDVSLRIRKTHINFGNINKNYKLGLFTNINKRIDGISIVGEEGPFKYNFGFGQEKSKNDKFTRQGSGVNEYALKNKPILENSLKVYVNDVLMKEGVDYQANYFEGTVTFTTPKTTQDDLTFDYEYTNPIEDFIPIASNVNFFGIQGEYSETPGPLVLPKYKNLTETFSTKTDINAYILRKKPVKFASESLVSGKGRLILNQDYYIHYDSGKIYLLKNDIPTFSVKYQSPETIKHKEVQYGKGKKTMYYLRNSPILEKSEQITVQGVDYIRESDYKIDYENGRIMFLYAIPKSSKINITYEELVKITVGVADQKRNYEYDAKFGFFREFAKAQKDLNTKLASDTYETPTKNMDGSVTIETSKWPLVVDSYHVYANNVIIASASYTVDTFKGTITVNASAIPGSATYNIYVDYYYYKEYGPTQWTFSGLNDINEDYRDVSSGRVHVNTIESNQSHPFKYDKTNSIIQVEYKNNSNYKDYYILTYGEDYTLEYINEGVNVGQLRVVFYGPDYNGGDTISSVLPYTFSSNDNFKITYKYNKSEVPDPGEISLEQLEVVYHQNFAKQLEMTVDVSKTSKKYSRQTATTTNYLATNGQYGYTYSLAIGNLVEDSETVYINDEPNAIKNEDYYINYTTGKLTFINLNPSVSDNVYVVYSYYTTQAGDSSTQDIKEGTAINLKTQYTNDISQTSVEILNITDKFSPLGTAKYAAGSDIINFATVVKPNTQTDLATSYYINNKDISSGGTKTNIENRPLKQKEEKIMGEVKYRPYKELNLSYKWEKHENSSDLEGNLSTNARAVDNVSYINNIGIAGGPANFYSNFSLGHSDYFDDFLDNSNPRNKTSKTWTFSNKAKFFEDKLIFDTSFSNTNELDRYTISADQNLSETNKDAVGIKVTTKPLNYLNIDGSFNKEITERITSFDANNKPISGNQTIDVLQNYGSNINFKPPVDYYVVTNPNYYYSLSHSEKSSLLLNQNADTSDSFSNRLSWKFVSLTNISLRDSMAISKQSNNRIHKNSKLFEYTINGFDVIKGTWPLKLKNITRKFTEAENSNDVPKNTTNFTKNKSFTSGSTYGLTFSPAKLFDYSVDYQANTNYSYATENKTTEVIQTYQDQPNILIKQSVAYSHPDFIKTNYNYENNTAEHYKLTRYLATTNITSENSRSIYNKTTHKIVHSYSNVLLPKTFPINTNMSFSYDDYIDTSKGLKYRTADSYSANNTLKMFGFNITPKAAYNKTQQYLRTSDDVTLDEIKNNNYDSYLKNDSYAGSIGLSKQILSNLSLLADYSYQNIKEHNEVPPTIDNKSITVHGLGTGLVYKILPDLSAKYKYTYKTNINNISNQTFANFADELLIQYTPIAINDSKLKSKSTATIKRIHNWGIGLNDFSKVENNQVNDTTLSTEIKGLNNITTEGSLKVDIEIPMTQRSNGTIEKFIFTAEGKIVEKKDLTGSSDVDYTITSLIFSGKIIF